MRPMFSFFGSKWNLAKRYGAPKHSIIVEPFAGSASYSLYWNAPRAILIDRDEVICGIWTYLIAAKEREILRLPIDFEHIDDLRICQEAKWLLGFWIKKGGAEPGLSRTAWARQYRHDKDCKVWGEAARARIAKQLPGIRQWRIIHESYQKAPDINATWFIDPPYAATGHRYKFSAIDFSSLAKWCMQRKGQIFVCENQGARWLKFKPLHLTARGTFGAYRSGRTPEVAYIR